MKTRNKFSAILLSVLFTGACTYDFPEGAQPTSGDADFTKMVVIGSSMTAGFMNGALYNAGQENSFVSIIATQMEAIGGGAFNQPDINAIDGYYATAQDMPPIPDGTILGRLYLKGTTSPKPTPKIPGQAIGAFAGDKAALNNFSAFGIPIQLSLAAATSGPNPNQYYNPYFARFAKTPSVDGTTGSSLISDAADALADDGSFFIFWLGNDDVLGFATNGADENDPTKPLTSEGAFSGAYGVAIAAILGANENTTGVIANIPDVTALPYFSTVTYNAIPLPQANADALNAGYADFNDGIAAYNAGLLPGQTEPPPANMQRPTINFVAGQNAIVIADQYLPDLTDYGIPSIRQATANDLICLPAGSILGVDLGSGPKGLQDPLEDKYVVLPTERTLIQERITAFNTVIANTVTANSSRLALVNVNAILAALKANPVNINGSTLTASITPPFGGFSLDGIHPNARGNAYIANKFIEIINGKFKSTIPYCNPNSFAGNELPVP